MKRTVKTIEFTWEERTSIAANRRRSLPVKRADESGEDPESDKGVTDAERVPAAAEDLEEGLSQ